jgi:hypothetical protein
MTLRNELEAMLEEFEHFAYEGAPLDVAVDKVREILDRTKPRVLTTVEELDSVEASKALCLVPGYRSGILGFYRRTPDGENEWTGLGTDNYFTSAELLADCANNGDKPRFTLVHDVEGPAVSAQRVLTTEAELNSADVFEALCLIRADGLSISPYSREDGVNSWAEFGTGYFKTSARILSECAKAGVESRFTVVERPDVPKAAPRVLTTEAELNSADVLEALCIVPDGGLPRTWASSSNGVNYWQEPGVEREYSSAELLARVTAYGDKPAFTVVDLVRAPAGRRVLTTLEDLNSAEAFYALCIVPYGGPLRVAMRRNNGVNYWREPGYAGEYDSAELLAHFASIGAEPAFTLIPREP